MKKLLLKSITFTNFYPFKSNVMNTYETFTMNVKF